MQVGQALAHSGPAGLRADPAAAVELLQPDHQGEFQKLYLQAQARCRGSNTHRALTVITTGPVAGWYTVDGGASVQVILFAGGT